MTMQGGALSSRGQKRDCTAFSFTEGFNNEKVVHLCELNYCFPMSEVTLVAR